jgi:hypothetical protein
VVVAEYLGIRVTLREVTRNWGKFLRELATRAILQSLSKAHVRSKDKKRS